MAHARITYGNPFRYYADGVEVTKEEFDRIFPSRPISQIAPQVLMETSGAWPRKSDALGCGRRQKKKYEEACKRVGVPTEYVPDGAGGYSALIRNNEHQRKLLKALGMKNNDGGYGQVTG